MASALIHKIENKMHKAAHHTSPEGQHLAAILKEQGQPFVIEDRPTPKCGPNEVLVEVHSLAVNPVDYKMREGFMVKSYPAVLGSDIAGVVLETGAEVPEGTPQPGKRVLGLCPTFFTGGSPDYGAFQRKVLVPVDSIAAIPDWLNFDEACKLPMAVFAAWNGWYATGAPIDKIWSKEDKRGMLVWGGSGSLGSIVIQIGRLMGYAVYTTCSSNHHMYTKSIGAHKVFDYKHENVVQEIVTAMKDDGMTVEFAYDCAGALAQCNEVLKAMNPSSTSKLASATPLTDESPRAEGVDVKFVVGPADVQARLKWMRFLFVDWLTKVLEEKKIKPSPPPKLIKGGLKALDGALDQSKAGVSGVKLILHTMPELK